MIRDIIKIIYKMRYIWKAIRNLCDEKNGYLLSYNLFKTNNKMRDTLHININ